MILTCLMEDCIIVVDFKHQYFILLAVRVLKPFQLTWNEVLKTRDKLKGRVKVHQLNTML